VLRVQLTSGKQGPRPPLAGVRMSRSQPFTPLASQSAQLASQPATVHTRAPTLPPQPSTAFGRSQLVVQLPQVSGAFSRVSQLVLSPLQSE
jgi:hypothetical protein